MSSFVKHPSCTDSIYGCTLLEYKGYATCSASEQCAYVDDRLTFFEARDTDEEARLDRKARARECK